MKRYFNRKQRVMYTNQLSTEAGTDGLMGAESESFMGELWADWFRKWIY